MKFEPWIKEDLTYEIETILLWAFSGSWILMALARVLGVFGA